MNKFVLATALTLSLTACGTPAEQAKTQAQAVYALEGTYEAAALAERNYIAGTFGKPDPAVVVHMKDADNKAYALIVTLRADAQAGRPIVQTALDAATTAVDQLKSTNASVGAH